MFDKVLIINWIRFRIIKLEKEMVRVVMKIDKKKICEY